MKRKADFVQGIYSLFIVFFGGILTILLLSSCASHKYGRPQKRAPVGGWHKKFDLNPGGYHSGGGKQTPF